MNTDLILSELRHKLKVAVQNNSAEGLLFSGGLDTSVLVALCPQITAIHVCLEDFGEDLEYAKKVENFFPHLKVHYKKIKIDDAIASIPQIVKILKSFDPAIPNDISIYFGLNFAKELGITTIMTGDGADELFCGYEYMKHINNLDNYIRRLVKNMHFNSNLFGKFFGMEIKQPYLDKEFIDFAVTKIPIELKLRKENGMEWGKWILRKAFEDLLPKEIIWQNKRPIEYGSGTNKLRKIIASMISDDEFRENSKCYSVKFMSKEHLYYYKIYREVIGEIPRPRGSEKMCPYCGGGMLSFHCKICGGVTD